ncbi:hypothetical protein [Streptomyces aurantiogriseus]|uniref:Uncharacterized protein n=1 Tax=Streptomyces aurantiogriseus TaxID=66870 RepID=A0A918FNT0_9ACTN|nr:hypothetical protein [Streptomyces aurantiogriseus]GGR61016.1 hypothetical protein GCM10010251_92130 [Streptomyces aurantiogriseus]
MYDTHSPAEWAAMGSLSVSLFAAVSAPYFLLVEAEVWAWPSPLVRGADRVRPAVGRAVDWLLVEVANARFDAREFAADARSFARLSLREAAVSVAALLALLTITPEHR